MENKKFVIRCKAVILHDGKLLVVRHSFDTSFAALPGGHLDFGEDVKECLSREIKEELGIEPEIGSLLYISTFVNSENTQSMEFFFEVKNGKDYLEIKRRACSHAHELAEIHWASPDEDIKILPEKFAKDFKEGKVKVNAEGREGTLGYKVNAEGREGTLGHLSDEVRYIKGGK